MTYTQALDFIHSRLKFGSKLGLESPNELMRRLGEPHKKLKFIHVAGTNGKGSTSSYIASILMAAGHKVGMFISPYVNSFTERIQINNMEIDEQSLAKHTATVASVIGGDFQPTEFEIITAIGMLYFAEQECDFVVLEVGLGGRFDATNIIPAPFMSVITSISIDHTELLGNMIAEIAFEKCGIIKTGSKLAVYPDNPNEALEVIYKTANDKNVPVYMADKDDIKIKSQDISSTVFALGDEEYEIKMLGKHQVYNAVTAITAVLNMNLGITYATIKKGLKAVNFRGRLEIIHRNPDVIVDGAHNYSGVLTLKDALKTYFCGKRIILVMGMLRDKEYEKCAAELMPLAHSIITTEPANPRALTAQELAEVAKQYNNKVTAISDRYEAVKYALSIADENNLVCICGSLYLIGGISIAK